MSNLIEIHITFYKDKIEIKASSCCVGLKGIFNFISQGFIISFTFDVVDLRLTFYVLYTSDVCHITCLMTLFFFIITGEAATQFLRLLKKRRKMDE